MKIRTMAAGAVCLCAALSASATEWTYSEDSSKNYITDGQWKLQVGKLTAASNTVKIAWLTSCVTASDESQKGVLDLRSPLKIKIGDGEATITSVNLASLGSNTTVVKFYCDIVGSLTKEFFNDSSKMTTLEIGGSATELPCPLLKNCTALETVKFNFLGLRTVGGSGSSLFSGTETNAKNLQDIDVSMVAGPGVTSVGKYALKCQKIAGDLVLTNVATIAESAFQDTKLTSVSLAGTLTTLSKNAFGIVTSGLSGAITNVVLDLPSLSSIDSTAFTSQKKIRRVEIVTALSNMSLVKNIVASADNTDFKELAIYVSTNQWTATAAQTYSASNTSGIFRELTDDEKGSAPDGAFGVFVLNGTAKGVFVHKASHSDPDPIVEGKWTYRVSNGEKTITDGQWTFKVGALTKDSTSITLEKNSLIGWQAPSDTSKTGILDLRSPLKITVSGTETEIKSVEFAWNVFASWSDNSNKISGFYCDILSSLGGKVFYGNQSISNVVIGGSAETIPEGYMVGCIGVTNIVLDLPNLKSIYNSQAVELKNVHSVEIPSAFSDMGLVTNIVRYVSGTADQTGCRVYISKRQWTKEARDAATYSADENPAGYFAGKATFTESEKEKIKADSTLAKAYGVLVVGGVRKAFVVNKASPHDKVTGLMIIIR